MRKHLLSIAVSMGIFAAVAYAANASYDTVRRIMKAGATAYGLIIGATGTEISDSYAGSGSFDPPALGAGEVNCSDSSPITVTGAALGDPCIVASNHGMDGGAILSVEIQPSCYVSAANAVKVRLCAGRADAGTVDIGDAGYFVRVFDP